MWVVIHMCMETIQRMSLYSYLHLKLAKTLHFPICFFFNKIGEENSSVEQVLPRGGVAGEVAQIMYTL
jgi:hypothetical protein